MAKQVARLFLLLSTVAFVSGSSLAGVCPQRKSDVDEKTSLPVSVKSVAENPQQYLKKTVRIRGRLQNQGKNYFTDLRVVLTDDQGNQVYVRPWLPTELPPSPPGYRGKRPDVLSNYLGKKVELTAILDQGTLKKVGKVYLLRVKSARVVR